MAIIVFIVNIVVCTGGMLISLMMLFFFGDAAIVVCTDAISMCWHCHCSAACCTQVDCCYCCCFLEACTFLIFLLCHFTYVCIEVNCCRCFSCHSPADCATQIDYCCLLFFHQLVQFMFWLFQFSASFFNLIVGPLIPHLFLSPFSHRLIVIVMLSSCKLCPTNACTVVQHSSFVFLSST